MCRFLYYQGETIHLSHVITEPGHSLIHQSFSALEREEPLNGDGFGLAWYVPEFERPALFRSVSPAWSNQNLLEIARVTRSSRILAHVRAATQGIPVSERNCHPFRFERFAFMHNGDIGGFRSIRRQLLNQLSDEAFGSINGSTDSEHFFALVRDELVSGPGGRLEGADRLAAAVEGALAKVLGMLDRTGVAEHTYMNAVLTDGEHTIVTRFTTDEPDEADSLYWSTGRCYTCELAPHDELDAHHGPSVVVSSEPLTADEGWSAVPVGSLLAIDPGGRVEVRPIRP